MQVKFGVGCLWHLLLFIDSLFYPMKTLVVALSVIALLVFPTLSARYCRQPIADRLVDVVSAELASSDGVTVKFDGLQGVLSGEVPDEATRERLLAMARAAAPAGRVADGLTVVELPPESASDDLPTGTVCNCPLDPQSNAENRATASGFD